MAHLKDLVVNGDAKVIGNIYGAPSSLLQGQALTSKGTTATTQAGEIYGVAGVTTSPYNYTKWIARLDNGVTALTDGMIVKIRVPVAGCNYGCSLSINGSEFHPIVYNNTSIIKTHYSVNAVIALMYDSVSAASTYTNSATAAAVTGVWRVLNNQDNDTNTKVTQTVKTDNVNRQILTTTANRTANATDTSVFSTNIYANASTGTITATNFAGKINNHTVGADVPTPGTNDKLKFLRGDGTWQTITSTGGEIGKTLYNGTITSSSIDIDAQGYSFLFVTFDGFGFMCSLINDGSTVTEETGGSNYKMTLTLTKSSSKIRASLSIAQTGPGSVATSVQLQMKGMF